MSQSTTDHRSHRTTQHVATELSAATGDDFMHAVLAAGALMAFADGEMAPAERRRILRHIQDNPMLATFSHSRVTAELTIHEANFRFDPEVAQMLAREKLMRVERQRRLARKIVAFAREIIPADGVAHPGEYRVLAEIATLMGIQEVAAASRVRSGANVFIPRAD